MVYTEVKIVLLHLIFIAYYAFVGFCYIEFKRVVSYFCSSSKLLAFI